ncbi:MAG: heterodisulfide reductase-related iron-sulfur binding cluster [Thermoleophilia bacterium]
MRDYAVFWGCTIPARFPSIEKATRLVFDDLQLRPHELPGHTCCPEGTLVKAKDPAAFYATAARNLAIVGRAGLDLVTPCNGCYSTFKETQRHLTASSAERTAVDGRLAGEGLAWPESLRVLHLAEWLADVEGTPAVARRAVRDLGGMRLAVHYGCHLLRPQPAVSWDDPLRPSKVESLVKALGARVVDYPSKMQCCGGALDRLGERDASLALARRKLHELGEHGVDALVVVCPSCFQQFDLNQAALQRAGENVGVPVLYLTELLALCYGHAPEEIGLSMHRVSVEPFLERWAERAAGRARARESFDLRLLEECDACRACRDDCPVAKVDPDFQPNEIVARILDGDLDAALASGQAWKCLECYTCLELCPSRIGLAETLRAVKERAAAQGGQPEALRQAFELFAAEGVLGKPRQAARGKLGLPPLPPTDGAALARLLAADAAALEETR